MWDFVKGVSSAFKSRKVDIDSTIFKLHYQVTFCLLLIFTMILAANQYVGTPIRCMHHLDGHSEEHTNEVLDTYCWIHSTYTVTSAFYKRQGVEVPYPGVDASRGGQKETKVYRFYQWVSFCLLFQAVLFYAPRWLWKIWEAGKLQELKLDMGVGVMTEVTIQQKKEIMIAYLESNFLHHNFWVYKYFFCECLALFNVIGQMFLMNRFLDGEFLNYGTEVINFMQSDQEDRVDPMIYLFPRMTKCTFYKFGFSGEVERHDAICVLPLNIVNEKIYIFLWFWFIILATLTFILVVYRVFIITSTKFRVLIFTWSYRRVKKARVREIAKKCSLGTWYLLYMIGVNIDNGIFYETVEELATNVKRKSNVNLVQL